MTWRDAHEDLPQYLGQSLDRRRLLKFTAAAAVSVPMVSLLAACGDDEDAAGSDESDAAAGDDMDGQDEDEAPGADDEEAEDTDGEPSGSDDSSQVSIAQGVDIASFDPHEDTSSAANAVFANVFDHLVARDQNLEPVPALAETWEVDEETWTFEIREGVTFHDGTELTSRDAQFTYDYVLDPENESRQLTRIEMIQQVEAPDDFTLRLITGEPFPALLDRQRNIFILPAETFQDLGREEFAVNPVGTGPYQFVEWIRDDHILLERFDDHWRGAASIASVQFRPIQEASTRVSALRAGEIHVSTLVPVTDVPEVEQQDGVEIRSVRSLRTIFVGMNTWIEPLNDVRVRQALNYAVDVDSIIDNLLDGFGYKLASVSGPSEFGYNPDLEPYSYDPDRARELLAEAGYSDGFQTVLDTPSGRYLQDVEVSQAIAGQLAEVGIDVEVRPAEFQEYFDRWLDEAMEGLYFLGVGGSLDADGVMGSHFDSERRGLYYNSPESDELIHQAMQETDQQAREAIYHELMEYLYNEAPWIFLYSQEDIYGVSSDLVWEPVSDERLWVYDMSWS